ncbi:MAG: CxxxxCH/CxxCH domain-containing protein [Myxococcales bacterium]|nr:MAG: CxxxxCH/CxxCH domain-containing protein [Myxococcales bacterium]
MGLLIQVHRRTLFIETLARVSCVLVALGLASCSSTRPDPQDQLPQVVESSDPACYTCHGNSLSPAPPRGLGGTIDSSTRGVGAHRSHIGGISTWHKSVTCDSCHLVPAEVNSPGHIDDGDSKAELTFSALATTGGLTPEIRDDDTCTNVYCHGATLSGGTLNEPLWTRVDGTQNACGTCHGNPPPAPHPASSDCGLCHSSMQAGTNTFLDPSRHIDGVLDLGDGSECVTCHGSDLNSAPPLDLDGNTDRSFASVGAHRQHFGGSDWHRTLSCSNCHTVPSTVDSPGHIDGDNVAEVPFDELNPSGSVNFANATCSNLYCHGNGKSSNGTVSWTSTEPMQCGSCHGNPPPAPHPQASDCGSCHPTMNPGSDTFRTPERHIDGVLDVTDGSTACDSCHGSNGISAPPLDLAGNTARTVPGVGAHRVHLGATSWARQMSCESCHVVPDNVDSPGHLDGDNIAEVSFGALNPSASVNLTTHKCNNLYCHGDGTASNGSISWTSTTAMTCSSCHGYPPPSPHPDSTACGSCHPNVNSGTDTFNNPSSHIDGIVNVNTGGACDSCHGSNGNSAPPKNLAGSSTRSARGVGAHREHLSSSTWRRTIACESCHTVPGNVDSPGHIDGDNVAEIPFDGLNPSATVDFTTGTCNSLYCHGNGRGNNGSINWTSTTDMACSSCHLTPAGGQSASGMSGDHNKHIKDKRIPCSDCHAQVVNQSLQIIDSQLHIDGTKNVLMPKGGNYDPSTRRCSNLSCHGSETW